MRLAVEYPAPEDLDPREAERSGGPLAILQFHSMLVVVQLVLKGAFIAGLDFQQHQLVGGHLACHHVNCGGPSTPMTPHYQLSVDGRPSSSLELVDDGTRLDAVGGHVFRNGLWFDPRTIDQVSPSAQLVVDLFSLVTSSATSGTSLSEQTPSGGEESFLNLGGDPSAIKVLAEHETPGFVIAVPFFIFAHLPHNLPVILSYWE